MALTRDFKQTIQARVQRDPAFREELLKEGIECLLSGDADTGKAVLRDYINATIGFEELGSLTHKSPKSLMRMFGSSAILRLAICSRSSAIFSAARAFTSSCARCGRRWVGAWQA